jgi:hypothetical protein
MEFPVRRENWLPSGRMRAKKKSLTKKTIKKVRLFNPIPITQHLIRPHQWNFVQTFFQVLQLADEGTLKMGLDEIEPDLNRRPSSDSLPKGGDVRSSGQKG